jgi:TPR repeat protein
LIYESGISQIVLADISYSISLLQEAADFSYPPALYKLGSFYEHGAHGFFKDLVSYIKLMK